jgi:pilus assembly protein CpaC
VLLNEWHFKSEISIKLGRIEMNEHNYRFRGVSRYSSKFIIATLVLVLLDGFPSYAADIVKSNGQKTLRASTKVAHVNQSSTEILPKMEFSLGESRLIKIQTGANLKKVKVDDDKIVQVDVTSPKDIVFHAKTVGSTSIMIWDNAGRITIMDVKVVGVTSTIDANALQGKLLQIMPNEKGIIVRMASDSLVLSGNVSDASKADKAMILAEAFAGKDKKAINMLQVSSPQQVMLEVQMAEVSKNILDQLGASIGASRVNGGVAYAIASGFLSLSASPFASTAGMPNSGAGVSISHGKTAIKLDAQNTDGIVKILAEPNIIAISGQEGSFLAGGKIYIPIPQSGGAVGAITLQEEEFGVGLKFTPTVLDDGLINLKVSPEVSELASGGTLVGSTVFPTITTRRVSTTVQLHDGQSFAIAGLIKNNVTESIARFPVLGEIPILGALFRSSSFQNNKTELLFVVTPRLVKSLPSNYTLPTDNFSPPSNKDIFLNGQLEHPIENKTESTKKLQSSPVLPEQNNAQEGFEMK